MTNSKKQIYQNQRNEPYKRENIIHIRKCYSASKITNLIVLKQVPNL